MEEYFGYAVHLSTSCFWFLTEKNLANLLTKNPLKIVFKKGLESNFSLSFSGSILLIQPKTKETEFGVLDIVRS